jgi:hypothetical protein
MEVTAEEVIDRARMFSQDDFNDNKGAILKPERWLQLFNSLYKKMYKRWLRSGLISPAPNDREFTGPRVRLSGVLAVQGVCRATIVGYANQVVDLFDYIDEVTTHPYYRIKDYEGATRPSFVVVPGVSATLTMTGNAITLTFDPGVTTVNDINTLVFNSSFMELVQIPATADATVLDNLKSGQYWGYDPKVYNGEVLMSEFTPIKAAQKTQRFKTQFNTNYVAPAVKWEGTGFGGTVDIKLVPADNTSQSYVVRYYALPTDVETKTELVVVPDGADNYLALKLAELAMMTEGGSSKKMAEMIYNEEAELGFAAAELQPPRLKASKSTPELTPDGWPLYRYDWTWF